MCAVLCSEFVFLMSLGVALTAQLEELFKCREYCDRRSCDVCLLLKPIYQQFLGNSLVIFLDLLNDLVPSES